MAQRIQRRPEVSRPRLHFDAKECLATRSLRQGARMAASRDPPLHPKSIAQQTTNGQWESETAQRIQCSRTGCVPCRPSGRGPATIAEEAPTSHRPGPCLGRETCHLDRCPTLIFPIQVKIDFSAGDDSPISNFANDSIPSSAAACGPCVFAALSS